MLEDDGDEDDRQRKVATTDATRIVLGGICKADLQKHSGVLPRIISRPSLSHGRRPQAKFRSTIANGYAGCRYAVRGGSLSGIAPPLLKPTTVCNLYHT